VLIAIRSGWIRSRVLVYGGVLLGTFLTGMVPMVAAIATTLAMTLANVLLIRSPLQWLPPTRRIWTWLRIDLWFLALTVASFLLHALAATWLLAFGSGALLSAITGLAVTFLYIEGSLGLVANEVERISRGGVA
jgi:fucose 4-O-acetylase-like acetyltransferase